MAKKKTVPMYKRIKKQEIPVKIIFAKEWSEKHNKPEIEMLDTYAIIPSSKFPYQKYFFNGLILHNKILRSTEPDEDFDYDLDCIENVYVITDVDIGRTLFVSNENEKYSDFIRRTMKVIENHAKTSGKSVEQQIEDWLLSYEELNPDVDFSEYKGIEYIIK